MKSRGYLDKYAPRAPLGGWYFANSKGCHWDPDGFSTDSRTANNAAGLS